MKWLYSLIQRQLRYQARERLHTRMHAQKSRVNTDNL